MTAPVTAPVTATAHAPTLDSSYVPDDVRKAVAVVEDMLGAFARLPAYLVYRTVYDNVPADKYRVMRYVHSITNHALAILCDEGRCRVVLPSGLNMRITRNAGRGRLAAMLPIDTMVYAVPGTAYASGDRMFPMATYVWAILDEARVPLASAEVRRRFAERTGTERYLSSVIKTLVDKHLVYSTRVGRSAFIWAMTTGDESVARHFR